MKRTTEDTEGSDEPQVADGDEVVMTDDRTRQQQQKQVASRKIEWSCAAKIKLMVENLSNGWKKQLWWLGSTQVQRALLLEQEQLG
jgi:hypothetical protein